MTFSYLKNLLAFVIILALCSCKKYLDEKSDKTLVIPKSLNDLQGLLDDNFFMNTVTPGYAETAADDYFVTTSDYNSFFVNAQKAYTWRAITDFDDENDWQLAYRAIYNSNYCLEQIDKNIKTEQNTLQWNNVKGSALFFRSYYFLELAWVYANAYDVVSADSDLGIVLRESTDFNVKSERASVAHTYEKIITDLKESILYLPHIPQQQMRPSKASAYGTLARTYLSMRNYDSAYLYANLALQIKSDLLDYNNGSEVDPSSFTPFQPFNKEVIFHTTMTGNYISKAPTYALIDTTLFNTYDNNDLRKTVFFFDWNGYKGFKGNYNAFDIFTLFSGIATNELLLIRAESNARLNKVNEAMIDLNSLLIKRWLVGTFTPLSANTADQAVDLILQERRKELLMRGLRWIDVKRLNKENRNIELKRIVSSETYTLLPNDKKYALPLPASLIQLTSMPQNPGW